MRNVIVISITAFIALVIGCDDGGTGPGGQDPPKPGYVWEVWEFYYEDGYWYPPLISVWSYSTTGGEDAVRSAHAPFSGYGHDAAYGDGRLWVAAEIYERDLSDYRQSGPVIWEIGNGYFESPHIDGLTWDGEQLWGCSSYGEFYTINPDTHESELMFTYGDHEYSFTGLAWDGEYLWAITPTTNEVIQINPSNGSEVHSVPYPEPKQYLFMYNYGLTWDGEALLLSDPTVDVSIYRISPEDGSVLWFLYTGEKSPHYGSVGLAFEPSE